MFLSVRSLFFPVAALSAFQLSACGDSVDSCEDTRSCASGGSASTGDGDGDPGSGGRNQTGSGGTEGDGDGDGDTTDTDTGGETGDGDGDQCLPALCPDGYCVGTECLECVQGDDEKECKDNNKPVCLDDNTCAQCATNDDCTDPEASVCDPDTNECIACSNHDDCSHLEGTTHCLPETNTCVECTIETEIDKCGAKSCDPATNTCTSTNRGSRTVCQACVADSECEGNHHCVPMKYKGEERGGYCLQVAAGNCARPFTIDIEDRETLSGVMDEVYCGINEAFTTCEAVLALRDGQICTDNELSCPEGGFCRKIGNIEGKGCTYECSHPSQCITDAPYDTCKYGPASGGSSGTGGGEGGNQKYCGGTQD